MKQGIMTNLDSYLLFSCSLCDFSHCLLWIFVSLFIYSSAVCTCFFICHFFGMFSSLAFLFIDHSVCLSFFYDLFVFFVFAWDLLR